MKIVFELPFYSPLVGGITESIKFAERLGAHIRFQRKSSFLIPADMPHSVGMPDNTFPQCDICVTYSDNPYTDRLCQLRQIGRIMVYMMSYGMSITNERRNVHHPKVTALCTTKKIESAIVHGGGKVHRIGFALDMEDMVDLGNERRDTISLYYHHMQSKRYEFATSISDHLYRLNFVESVITFGSSENYNSFRKPAGLQKHYMNAKRSDVLEVFNSSNIFVNPSVSEGLSLTPIESTLCGCPAVICDGAIGEIFIDKQTCFVAKQDDFFDITNQAIELLCYYETYRKEFAANMRDIVSQYTWDKLIKKFKEVI